MRFKIIVITSLIFVTVVACDSKKRVKASDEGQQVADSQESATGAHKIKVEEVIQANSYTYLRVTEGDQEYWIATAKQPIEKGSTMYYDQGLEMQNFVSKELDRTFDSIWFVGKMRGSSSRSVQKMGSGSMGSGKQPARDTSISVSKVSGGLSIEELYSDMSAYEGKIVTIKGEVTKYNANIMGSNWVHLQDGTSKGAYFDVTLTTKDAVQVGDVVVFSGKVVLNKDFGAGYKYDLIIEDAALSTEG